MEAPGMKQADLTEDKIRGAVLDHLGLVSAAMDELGLVALVDQRVPISEEKGAKVSLGQRVAAMILNGLGFIDTRLYMFSEFLENKPVERLIGEGLCAQYFSDDCLGRGLDRIYDYGPTRLFSELAFEIGSKLNLLGKSAHLDSTSLSVEGSYKETGREESVSDAEREPAEKANEKESDDPSKEVHVTYGYSKQGRRDLKQVVLNLATTGAASFPIWMESHSGNVSDKKILREAAERMQEFCQKLEASPHFIYVADSAAYENCVKRGGELRWLSRIPKTVKAARELLQQPEATLAWSDPCESGYRHCHLETRWGGVHQRWCLVHSEAGHERDRKALEKGIEKEHQQTTKKLIQLGRKTFKQVEEAEVALNTIKRSLKYHTVEREAVEAVTRHSGRGRPKDNAQAPVVGYRIKGELRTDEDRIRLKRNEAGRFLLATNELDRACLPDARLLPEYKAQAKTEGGFRFIKDDTFEVSSIFLKKSSRISALMMVMTLCLMVYSYAQHRLRETLKESNEYLPDQLGKSTQNVTIQRVFRLFQGVQLLRIQLADRVHEVVINLNALLKRIIVYFGPKAQQIYSLSG